MSGTDPIITTERPREAKSKYVKAEDAFKQVLAGVGLRSTNKARLKQQTGDFIEGIYGQKAGIDDQAAADKLFPELANGKQVYILKSAQPGLVDAYQQAFEQGAANFVAANLAAPAAHETKCPSRVTRAKEAAKDSFASVGSALNRLTGGRYQASGQGSCGRDVTPTQQPRPHSPR
ncbi:MAG: hypothetical protein CMF50_02525 [Legionellales bacterium]|nr:hypothetical protein [Legionellales bacterium]